jgi:hypothetical protein
MALILGVLGFRSFVLLSCLAFRRVLATARRSLPRRAQAMEGEAEKLQLLFRYLDGS